MRLLQPGVSEFHFWYSLQESCEDATVGNCLMRPAVAVLGKTPMDNLFGGSSVE
jgi:hypothetical protein